MEECGLSLEAYTATWFVIIFCRNLVFKFNKNRNIDLEIKFSVSIVLGIYF